MSCYKEFMDWATKVAKEAKFLSKEDREDHTVYVEMKTNSRGMIDVIAILEGMEAISIAREVVSLTALEVERAPDPLYVLKGALVRALSVAMQDEKIDFCPETLFSLDAPEPDFPEVTEEVEDPKPGQLWVRGNSQLMAKINAVENGRVFYTYGEEVTKMDLPLSDFKLHFSLDDGRTPANKCFSPSAS